ncbi:uncharacterized protein LOC102810018 [Saccoglossus kowalevskii]|uniref:DNA primase large subunit-like n=1 Tax=Saccoglossus kowalevskii TaxID=10224 RepID=A0ABM0MFS2_SACKO|nr:PREDICTED: DNA primase large subunit-like [Saccoglossus kowalevskii]
MVFYVKPPRGKVPLETLRSYCLARVRFLCRLSKCATEVEFQKLCQQQCLVKDSECLIEGSKQDSITHFTLRLISAGDTGLSNFVIKEETKLFKFRFNQMKEEEIVELLYSLEMALLTFQENDASKTYQLDHLKEVADLVLKIKNKMSWTEVVRLFKNEEAGTFFTAPFQYALQSVASRDVTLFQGFAHVPYSKLSEVTVSLFQKLLKSGTDVAQRLLPTALMTDDRIGELFQDVRQLYRRLLKQDSDFHNNGSELGLAGQCSNVDGLVEMFPMCMSHLHYKLRQNHRLRHHSRVQYTLFLKEVGMSVEGALKFWRSEYSQPHGCHGDGCTHSWAKDGKRYAYSIRHLYGLEGGRTNYTAHSCQAIQSHLLGPGEEGGCPFKHFDTYHLQGKIEGIPDDTQDDIVRLVTKSEYNRACHEYLKYRVTSILKPDDGALIGPSGNRCQRCSGFITATEDKMREDASHIKERSDFRDAIKKQKNDEFMINGDDGRTSRLQTKLFCGVKRKMEKNDVETARSTARVKFVYCKCSRETVAKQPTHLVTKYWEAGNESNLQTNADITENIINVLTCDKSTKLESVVTDAIAMTTCEEFWDDSECNSQLPESQRDQDELSEVKKKMETITITKPIDYYYNFTALTKT